MMNCPSIWHWFIAFRKKCLLCIFQVLSPGEVVACAVSLASYPYYKFGISVWCYWCVREKWYHIWYHSYYKKWLIAHDSHPKPRTIIMGESLETMISSGDYSSTEVNAISHFAGGWQYNVEQNNTLLKWLLFWEMTHDLPVTTALHMLSLKAEIICFSHHLVCMDHVE